jgi:hypothetical protein
VKLSRRRKIEPTIPATHMPKPPEELEELESSEPMDETAPVTEDVALAEKSPIYVYEGTFLIRP